MPSYTYVHAREIRRWKTIDAPNQEEADQKFDGFLGTAKDEDWDEIEDNDEGVIELREVDDEPVDEIDSRDPNELEGEGE